MFFDSSLATVDVNKNLRPGCRVRNTQDLKCLKESLKIYKQQTKLNNEVNEKSRQLLQSLETGQKNSKQHQREYGLKPPTRNKENSRLNSCQATKRSPKRPEVYSSATLNKNVSKVNRDLIEYVKFRETYLEHVNHWQQIWLFTDNPIYEYGNLSNHLKKPVSIISFIPNFSPD